MGLFNLRITNWYEYTNHHLLGNPAKKQKIVFRFSLKKIISSQNNNFQKIALYSKDIFK